MSLAAVTDRDLSLPGWPRGFACAASVPADSTPAAQSNAGRLAALDALRRAGSDTLVLPPKLATVPRWPAGFVGSIAHDVALAVAVVAPLDVAHTVGIDVERHDALDARDATLVLTDDERDFAGDDNVVTTLLWCAKESAYKAWCTALGVALDAVDPRDIRVTAAAPTVLRIEADGALARRVASIGRLQGSWRRVDDLVVTLAWKLTSVSA